MVDEATIKKVAKIARLNLTESETRIFLSDMKKILDAFGDMSKVKTDGVEPTFQPIATKNVMRKDTVEKSLSQKDALSNSNSVEKGYFKGPKAI